MPGPRINPTFTAQALNGAMSPNPLRLLVVAYTLAATLGAALLAVGALGWVGAALVAWLGGATLVLGVAATSALRGNWFAAPDLTADATAGQAAEDAALGAALAAWEAERTAAVGPGGARRSA